MQVLDAGHRYRLQQYDVDITGSAAVELRFVKRNTPPEKYPGNVDAYPGTNCQEVIRVLLDRLAYLDGQKPSKANLRARNHLRMALFELEYRAHEQHKSTRLLRASVDEVVNAQPCPTCGHVFCTWCNT